MKGKMQPHPKYIIYLKQCPCNYRWCSVCVFGVLQYSSEEGKGKNEYVLVAAVKWGWGSQERRIRGWEVGGYTSNAAHWGIRSVVGGLVVCWQCYISILRGDPVRGDCCAGRRMDEALGIMGVFLLELYNPFIVYQNPKDKEGYHELLLVF